jgi:hypothetical protein
MWNCQALLKLKTISTATHESRVGPTIIRVFHCVSSRQTREFRPPAGFPTPGKCAIVVRAAEVLSSSFRALPQCAS